MLLTLWAKMVNFLMIFVEICKNSFFLFLGKTMYLMENNENFAFLNFPKNCDFAGFVMENWLHLSM
jgi:hypothetical protein